MPCFPSPSHCSLPRETYEVVCSIELKIYFIRSFIIASGLRDVRSLSRELKVYYLKSSIIASSVGEVLSLRGT